LARISGVDLEKNKRIDIALTRIYGVGRSSSGKILDNAGVDVDIRVVDLTESQVTSIRKVIDLDYTVEGELRKELSMDIKRLMDMGCYRGLRHRKNLPVRGQRTSTNARTRKGPKKGAVSKKTK
jgi:small subunit ribosomal protein S13